MNTPSVVSHVKVGHDLSARAALQVGTALLSAAGVAIPRQTCEWWLAHLTGHNPVTCYSERPPLSPTQSQAFVAGLMRLCAGEPLGYVMGEWEFCGLAFRVTPATLIPRQETELLVEEVGRLLEGGGQAAIAECLDVGTGCGNLAVSLTHRHPHVTMVASDCSGAALTVARENVQRHRLGARITLVASDLFEAFHPSSVWDFIVANLPYIPTGELAGLPVTVRAEPRQSLDGGPDGFACYRRFLGEAVRHVRVGGHCCIEMGANHMAALTALLATLPSFRLEHLVPDLAGRPRIAILQRRDVTWNG